MKTENPGVQFVAITAENAGQRIDNFLRTQLKGVPKSMIYRILRKGEVRVNKKRVKPEYKLEAGEEVRIPPVRVAERDEEAVSPKLQKELTKMAKRHMIYYRTLTPTVWVNIVDFGVELTLRYITQARTRRKTRDIFCQAILQRFQRENDIDFAYPTYRIYRRGEEET